MPKLFFFLVFLGFIITVLIGLFLWSSYSDDIDDIMPGVKVEPPENYQFIETEEGKFVENTNVGLRFKIPEGWTAEKKEVQKDEWVINVMSPDIKFGEDGLLTEGCGFSVWVERDEILANVTRTRLGEIADSDEDSEVVEIDGYSALKINIKKESWGEIQAIEIPIRDMVIKFDTLFRPETQKRCSTEFTEFLDEINIE